MDTAKNLTQTIAKQIAGEPAEILKQAGLQTMGNEQTGSLGKSGERGFSRGEVANGQQNEVLLEERDKVRSQRLIEALEAELKEIREARKQKEAVGAKQEEMVKEQPPPPPLVEPAVKRGRRLFGFGRKKTQMQRQQTQTERPLPPSG